MKKVRITLAKGSKGKTFRVFSSPEAAYVWLNDPYIQNEEELDPDIGITVHLKRGEVMEVEWRGCEYVKEEGQSLFKADFVRIGKTIKSPLFYTGGKTVIGIQDGWIVDEVSFKTSTDEDSKTVKLTKKSKHKFDLDDLFASRDKKYAQEEEEN